MLLFLNLEEPTVKSLVPRYVFLLLVHIFYAAVEEYEADQIGEYITVLSTPFYEAEVVQRAKLEGGGICLIHIAMFELKFTSP